MKKTLRSLYLVSLASFLFLSFLPIVHANTEVSYLTPIGKAIDVHGNVMGTLGNGETKNIAQEGIIFMGEKLETGEDGHVLIKLEDDTSLSLGPNGSFVIDHFVYSPLPKHGELGAKITQGIFRFITGKIAQQNPDKVNVELPAGTMGVRGTTVLGEITLLRSMIVLGLSEGESPTGHDVILSNLVGGKLEEVHLTRVGFGATIEGDNQAPSQPFQVSEKEMKRLIAGLAFEADTKENSKPDAKHRKRKKDESPKVFQRIE